MKKIILLFVSVIFLLVSCNGNKGINVPTSDSINKIKVEKLFVVAHFHQMARAWYRATHLSKNMVEATQFHRF